METNVVLAVLFWGCLLLGMPESRGQEAEWRKGTYPERYYPDGKLQAWMEYCGDTAEAVLSTVKKIPDPAVFADDPEGYMKLTGME